MADSLFGSFGSGAKTFPDLALGDSVGIDGGAIVVPRFYDGISTIDSLIVFQNTTIASLGLTPGTYSASLPNDTLTFNIGNDAAVPEPATASLLLFTVGALGLCRRRAVS